jgi:hypothetical protein
MIFNLFKVMLKFPTYGRILHTEISGKKTKLQYCNNDNNNILINIQPVAALCDIYIYIVVLYTWF